MKKELIKLKKRELNFHHPHITFRLNEKLDKTITLEFFINGEKAGFDFKKEIITLHPVTKKFNQLGSKGKLKLAIDDFVTDFYKKNNGKLIDARSKFQKIWNLVEDDFFKKTNNIFDNLDWPEGKYIGYISMLPIGARFLQDKTFQSCWLWKKNLKAQVIHELLHFQFYHLVEKITGKNQEENEKIWKLSEIFNDIVQREDEFIKLQGYAPKVGYPEHKNEHNRYLKIWQKKMKARSFIKETLKK